jgi:hypothetical protein
MKLNSLNIYYGNLDKLITECVTPAMDSLSSEIRLWFWERACIGGKHLKVRWREKSENRPVVGEKLIRVFSEFQSKNPSRLSAVYHPSAVQRLIETEKRNVTQDELEQKTDCAVSMPYERQPDDDASDELIEILHCFLNDTREFCTKIILSEADRKLLGLQLIAVFAIEQFGDLENGCITFRAHWDNYENWFKPSILPERIKEHYASNKAEFHKIVNEIMTLHQNGELDSNPVYAEWIRILRKYRLLVHRKQEEFVVFVPNPTTPQGVIATSNYLNEQNTDSRSEEFLRRLYSEPDYLGSLSVNKGLQMTRVMVNLIYHVISNLGISAFQRMSFCYFLHRSVEEILDIDIIDKLDEQMKNYLAQKQPLSEAQFGAEDLS